MRSLASEDQFASALQMTVKIGVTNCDNDGFSVDGDVLYGPGAAGAVGGVSVFGDPVSGTDPGDRLLGWQQEEAFCVNIALPLYTDNSMQDASTTLTMVFMSEIAFSEE